MEPVGSTYRQPWVSGVTTVRSAGELQRTPFGLNADAASGGIFAASALEQKGLQPSERSVDEFRPYLRSTQQNHEAGAAGKPASGTVPAGDTQEEQVLQIQAVIKELKASEEKVKAHEAAHKSAGGTMTGPISYTYTLGPDGKSYITGGEVPISVSPGKTPQETISRMQQVIRAALAPIDPSPQDRAVAAQAAAQMLEAGQKQETTAEPSTPTAQPSGAIEPTNGADSIVARDVQRAYGEPAVTGRQLETGLPHDDRNASATRLSSSLAAIIPANITGFGAFQPVSYYA